jgi:hypothetical protein
MCGEPFLQPCEEEQIWQHLVLWRRLWVMPPSRIDGEVIGFGRSPRSDHKYALGQHYQVLARQLTTPLPLHRIREQSRIRAQLSRLRLIGCGEFSWHQIRSRSGTFDCGAKTQEKFGGETKAEINRIRNQFRYERLAKRSP